MMKERFRKRHPYICAIGAAFLCTFMTGLGSAIPQILNLQIEMQLIVTTIFLIFSVLIGFFIINKTGLSLIECGFRMQNRNTLKKVMHYIPLVLIEVIAILLLEFSSEITINQYIVLLLFVIAVGFNEEIYFRGIAYNFLLVKGSKTAIIFSSIIFGVLHLANALNGKSLVYLILQMIFAFLVGFVLAEIVSITKSLWFLIIWHALHDYIASITCEDWGIKAIITLALQVCILLIYAIVIWKTNKKLESDNLRSDNLETIS
jgi:membrane protease YdiL (CAAX protease family)